LNKNDFLFITFNGAGTEMNGLDHLMGMLALYGPIDYF